MKITVTAQDTTTQRFYTVDFRRLPSANALLSDLKPLFVETFSPTLHAYTLNVLNPVSTITFTPTTDHYGATVAVNTTAVVSGASTLPGVLYAGQTTVYQIVVTAQDKATALAYTVDIARPFSPVATLDRLVVNGANGPLLPSFSPAHGSYTTTASSDTPTVTMTPTTTHFGATVLIPGIVSSANASGGNAVASGTPSAALPLVGGATSIFGVLVRGEDRVSSKLYTVHVYQMSNNALLQNLLPSEGYLDPAFTPNTDSYTVAIPNSVSQVSFIPTKAHTLAKTITVNGVEVASGGASAPLSVPEGGSKSSTVVVTAEDGTTVRSYTVTVARAPSTDAILSSLKLYNSTLEETLHPSWDPNVFAYTISTHDPHIRLAHKPRHLAASVMMLTIHDKGVDKWPTKRRATPIAVPAEQETGGLSLYEANTTRFELRVTAQDGITQHIYAVQIYLAPQLVAASTAEDAAMMPVVIGGSAGGFLLLVLCGMVSFFYCCMAKEEEFQEFADEIDKLPTQAHIPWDRPNILKKIRMAKEICEVARSAKEAADERLAKHTMGLKERIRVMEHEDMQAALSKEKLKGAQEQIELAREKAKAANELASEKESRAHHLESKAAQAKAFDTKASDKFELERRHSHIGQAVEDARAAHTAAAEADDAASEAERQTELAKAEAKRLEKEVELREKNKTMPEDSPEFREMRAKLHQEARRDKLKVVFRSFDLDNDGTLNENEFFEVGKALVPPKDDEFDGAEGDNPMSPTTSSPVRFAGFDIDSGWTRQQNEEAWEEIMTTKVTEDYMNELENDFNNRECGTGRVATMEEFVDYFIEKMKARAQPVASPL